MDVDQAHQGMDTGSISHFDLSPDVFPWREPIPENIETRRAHMSDILIFDILLSSGGITQPDILYPPADVASLRRLLHAIENCKYDALKRECLVYFLLKWYNDGREERFKFEKGIPPQFAALADAYWHLDTGINVARAVSILSDARLNKDYTSKILQAISLSENPMPLVLKYIRTAKPSLTEPDDLDLYVVALAGSSLLEAWQFQRTFPEQNATRSRLIRKILEWCLSPKPRPQPLTQLLAFPFSPFEQHLVHEYALHPPSECATTSIPVIQDLVCVRLIQSGQYSAAIKLDRQFSAASSSKATPKSQKASQDRRLMMDEIMATMPAVERDLLEAELVTMAKGKRGGAPVMVSSSAESFGSGSGLGDLSMSWEEVQPIRPAVDRPNLARTGAPSPAPAAVPLPVRSGAPRFGSGFPLVSSTSITNAPQNPFVPPQKNIFAAPLTSSQSQASTSAPRHRPDLSSSRAPAPQAGSSGLSFPAGLFSQSSPAHPSKPILTPASLFGSMGSAKKTRASFPEPPATNGTFSKDTPIAVAPPQRPAVNQPRPAEDEDMNMDSEDDVIRRLWPSEIDDSRNNSREEAELSFSVFSATGNNAAGPARQRTTRSDTKGQMLPGSFLCESEDEGEVARNNGRRRAPPPPQPPKQPRNVRVSKAADSGADLGRSLPGSLMAEEEEAEAEADDVAPLPASKRPARKSRTSRVGSYDGQGDSIQPRRSTRLSAAPSATSSSPEPSPKKAQPKPRKNTRASAVGTTVKSGTRKKR